MGEEARSPFRDPAVRGRAPEASPPHPRPAETPIDVEARVSDDQRHMRRVLELARRSAHTSPNPRVGAVVVAGGRILSESFHRGAGTPHAEALALDGVDAAGATLYVNLEPCTHQGTTPPCAPAVIVAGVARVVVALEDPDERVRGEGIAQLRSAGVDVEVGVLADEAARLNAPYLHHRRTGRAFLSLKLALTLDGKLAAVDGSSRWITSELTRKRVHARRLEADAVMVGSGTVLADDPRLTARGIDGDRQPLRVVVDSTGRVPAEASLVNDAQTGPVMIATTSRSPHEAHIAWKEAGVEVVVLPEDDAGRVDVGALLDELGRRSVVEVLCEGGATLATVLLRKDLVDRLELHYGPKLVGEGVSLGDLGVTTMDDAFEWDIESAERSDGDVLVTAYRRRG